MSCDLIRFKLRDVAAHSPPSNSAEHDCQASRLSINHTRNRCCQAKLEHGREDAAARSEGNPTLRCCAAGEQSSARPTPYQYRPHCRFQDIQTSKCSSLYPYSPCSYSTRREATRRLASSATNLPSGRNGNITKSLGQIAPGDETRPQRNAEDLRLRMATQTSRI